MQRKSIVCLLSLLLLAGCGPNYSRVNGARESMASNNRTFSYSHAISILMPHDAVAPRFQRARDACLNDKTLECTLVSASLDMQEGSKETGASADLDVALPHGKLADFEKVLLDPLPQDRFGKVLVASRSTQAENVGGRIADTDRKIAQLTAYRDSLAALAKRADTNVNDLIKLESELSKVQNDLDEALAAKRDLGVSVAKESLHATLSEKSALFDPIARVWSNGLDEFVASTASAIDFLIRAVPWLPIVAGGVFLISLSWRLFRRKKPAA
jgi:hypothetical protein